MMQEHVLARVRKDQVVLDRDGENIGTVDTVHRPVGVAAGQTGGSLWAGGYLRVSRGFLGGDDLFVPAGAITDVAPDAVLTDLDRERVEELTREPSSMLTEE